MIKMDIQTELSKVKKETKKVGRPKKQPAELHPMKRNPQAKKPAQIPNFRPYFTFFIVDKHFSMLSK